MNKLTTLVKKAESYSSPSITNGASLAPNSLPEGKSKGTPNQKTWRHPNLFHSKC